MSIQTNGVNQLTSTIRIDGSNEGELDSLVVDGKAILPVETNPPLVRTATETKVIIDLPQSSTVTDGYLSAVDHQIFDAKPDVVEAEGPLEVTGPAKRPKLRIPIASSTTTGALSSTDHTTFFNKVTQVLVEEPVVEFGTTRFPKIGVRRASEVQTGVLESTDYVELKAKVDAVEASSPLRVSGTAKRPRIEADIVDHKQDGILTSGQFNILYAKVSTVGVNSPLQKSGTDQDPIISIPNASALSTGALSSSDFKAFDDKPSTISVAGAVINTGTMKDPVIDVRTASTVQSGVVSSADFTTLISKVSSVTAVSPILQTGTSTNPILEMPRASATESGYLDKDDFKTFKTNPVYAAYPLRMSTLAPEPTVVIDFANTATDGALRKLDWNKFNDKVDDITPTAPLTGYKVGTSLVVAMPKASISQDGYMAKEDKQLLAGVARVTRECTLIHECKVHWGRPYEAQRTMVWFDSAGEFPTDAPVYPTDNNYRFLTKSVGADAPTLSTITVAGGSSFPLNVIFPGAGGHTARLHVRAKVREASGSTGELANFWWIRLGDNTTSTLGVFAYQGTNWLGTPTAYLQPADLYRDVVLDLFGRFPDNMWAHITPTAWVPNLSLNLVFTWLQFEITVSIL